MIESDLMWLAGLLEGEGSFCVIRGYPRVQVGSVDKDVIEKVADLLNVRMGGPHGGTNHNMYHAQLYRRAEVKTLCEDLWPYMSIRRKAQIDLVLENIER